MRYQTHRQGSILSPVPADLMREPAARYDMRQLSTAVIEGAFYELRRQARWLERAQRMSEITSEERNRAYTVACNIRDDLDFFEQHSAEPWASLSRITPRQVADITAQYRREAQPILAAAERIQAEKPHGYKHPKVA